MEAGAAPAENEYERQRLARIAANRQQLAALGLANAAARLGAPSSGPIAGWVAPEGDEAAPRPPRNHRRPPPVAAEELQPTRISKRKRGEAAEPTDGEAGEGPPPMAAKAAKADADEAAPGPRARIPFPEPRADLTVVAPFTLRSIGVTVWELGEVQRDHFATRFWSSKGCLFHHAYTVGYRASKTHFGRGYTMRIVAGPVGPRFRVTDDASGETFEGESPTKPWTGVCVSKRLGTRISGPLFFGFSDLMTMRALATLYTPAELAAARAGGTVASRAPTPEERAAAEFRRVDGMGEVTALTLAHTRRLLPSGNRITSLWHLAGFARIDGGEALTRYLTTSDEVPQATRRWPLWRIAFVPRIIAALLSDDPTAARADKENRAAERAERAAAAAAAKQRRRAAAAGEPEQLQSVAENAQSPAQPAPPSAKPGGRGRSSPGGASTPPALPPPAAWPSPPSVARAARSAGRRKHAEAGWVWRFAGALAAI